MRSQFRSFVVPVPSCTEPEGVVRNPGKNNQFYIKIINVYHPIWPPQGCTKAILGMHVRNLGQSLINPEPKIVNGVLNLLSTNQDHNGSHSTQLPGTKEVQNVWLLCHDKLSGK